MGLSPMDKAIADAVAGVYVMPCHKTDYNDRRFYSLRYGGKLHSRWGHWNGH